VIEIASLSKRYGKTLAVDDLSFSVDAGKITGFLGPNGAGKTTTLRALLGLVRPTSGNATIDGKHYADLEQPFKTVGAVLEASGFHPGRSGRNHLRLLALASGIDESRVDVALAQVGLTDAASKRVGAYSLGMRQRLCLAGAMLGNPQVLVLDEPANGLDPEGIHWLRDLLRGLAHEGRTILVSSHVLAEMSQTVDEVVIINKGKLIKKAPVEELLQGGARTVRVRGPQGDELASRIRAAGLSATLDGDALVVTGATTDQVGDAVAGLTLHELSGSASSLEEIFLELTAGSTPS
jgi:ABC-2 type transport system ATP-binding protein